MTITTLPDVEAALMAFLADDADVALARRTAVGPPAVYGSIDKRTRSGSRYPFLKVYRVGGPAEDEHLDHPLVQVEAIGTPQDLSTANDDRVKNLLLTAQAAIRQRLRYSTLAGVRFSGIETVTHMQDGYDDSTKQLRYFCRFTMAVHRHGA